MRIKMPAVRIAQADSDNNLESETTFDILTCGTCQKSFALAEIVKFIQHKITQCNKENYGQCYNQTAADDREPDDALSSSNSRRLSISAPISRKSVSSQANSPILSPSCQLLEDGSTSTPKRNSDDTDQNKKISTSDEDNDNKSDENVGIKQEHFHDEDFDSALSGQPPFKKIRSDCELVTNNINEPNSYMCSTCKNKYNSAWRLVQHVQSSHGVNIYIESAQQQYLGKSSSSRNNNTSGSSSNSSGSSQLHQSNVHHASTNLPRHHAILPPPPEMHPNPFGLLRMPLPPALSQVSHGFSRNHEFRMDQFEQFRHHGLNLAAAAVAAANQLNQNSLQDRTPPSGKVNVPPIPQMEAHLDFYSQRLRQLAGTTSPNTILSVPPVCSPGPRKQHSPSFASPSPSQLPPTPLTNNSRPQSITPPSQKNIELTKENGNSITATPRSASTPPNSSQSADSYLSCDFCEKRFKFQSNLIVHRRTHTGEDKYKCTSCDFSCTQVSLLRRHMKLHQNSEDRNSNSGSVETENDDSPDDLEEDEGDMDGFNENSVVDEENEEAEDLRISNVSNNEMLQDAKERHLLNSQSNAAASLVGELMDKFGLSNIAQYSEAYKQALQESGNALKLHLTNKDRDNNNTSLSIPGLAEKLNGFPAALRLKEELIAKNMLQHQNSQMPQVPLFNPFENPFDTSKRLKLEGNDSWWNLANFHRNESLLENIKSKIPSSLSGNQSSMHQQTKSKRNDTCEYCGKVFKNCSNLTVHRRSHTGEKPYKCELCSYACAQSSKLTRHMKTHGRLGKDVYRCRFCEMPFSVPSTLEKHMRKCVVNQGKSSVQQSSHMLLPPNIQNMQQQLGLQIGNHQNSSTNIPSNSSLNINCNSNGNTMCSLSMNAPRSIDENSNQSHGFKEEQA